MGGGKRSQSWWTILNEQSKVWYWLVNCRTLLQWNEKVSIYIWADLQSICSLMYKSIVCEGSNFKKEDKSRNGVGKWWLKRWNVIQNSNYDK